MKKIIFSLFTLLLISCISERYTYNDSIIIKTTKDSQGSDLKKINGIIQNINKDEFKAQLLIRFPDALTNYTDKIHIQVKGVTKSFNLKWIFKKEMMSKSTVIVKVQMNYDNSKEKQATQIVNYYKGLVAEELNKGGFIIGN